MRTYEKINGILFPVEYTEDGLVLMYYPDEMSYSKEKADAITKNGQDVMKKMIDIIKESGIKIVLGNTDQL